MIALLRTVFPLALVASCAAPDRLDAPKAVFNVEMSPYSMHEECVALRTGERLGYYFEARVPVAFNIHFHDGTAVVLPIMRDATSEESGDFTADGDRTYCLGWETGAQGSSIDYRLRLLGGRQ